MPHGSHIQYLSNAEIDKTKWDHCIDNASNGLIYGYSFYLDQMALHWDALVMNDYEAIMPLTWNKKFGISYLFQPPFAASLGVFGNGLNEGLINEFIQLIPKKFRLIEISLNKGNVFITQPPFLISRTNHILPLEKTYDELYKGYRENHQRNIQKALHGGCTLTRNISIDKIIELNKEQMKNVAPIKSSYYDRFKKLYEFLSKENKAAVFGALNKENLLIASCVFFFSHNRAFYIMAANHPAGRNTGASHLLIDSFIKEHAGQKLILDFEGSDVESVALFYHGFGARKEIFPSIRWNRLPWLLRVVSGKW
ncbi:MAG TPA: hypothetical protein VK588_15150 [Chitinophagaceae bacterium]|nr:hypothetical protein [Chitinophagaceae bacterium]